MRIRFFLFLAAALAGISASAVQFTSQLITNLPATGGLAFSSDPSAGAVMGGYLYFAASTGATGTTGRELWRTDGTAAGTTLVSDINPGGADSSPSFFTAAGTNLFFVADDGVDGAELWKSDGTLAGTALVADLTPGSGGTQFQRIQPVGNSVYFEVGNGTVSDQLYKSDGTLTGTILLVGPGGLVSTNNLFLWNTGKTNAVLLVASTTASNALWQTDGTLPGSVRLDFFPVSLSIRSLNVLDPMCYYVLDTGVYYVSSANSYYEDVSLNRRNLSPGSPPQAVETYNNGPCGTFDISDVCDYQNFDDDFQAINGRLFYSESGQSVDQNDGTDYSFTYYVTESNGSSPVGLPLEGESFAGITGNRTYFWFAGGYYYNDTTGDFDYTSGSIGFTDGTAAGTTNALDFTRFGLALTAVQQAGTKFFFTGTDTNFTTFFGVTDLTTNGTHLLPALQAGLMGALGTNALLSANDGIHGDELWISDGTTNGTVLLKDIAAGVDGPPPAEAVALGSNLLFSVQPPSFGGQLWKSDGTAAGTVLLKSYGAPGYGPTNLVIWNGQVYFAANDGTNGMELWRSDGTAAGTAMVKDGRIGPAGSNPTLLTPADGQLFFVADDGAHGAELWRSDGTSNGTFMVLDLVPGLNPAQIGNLGTVGNIAYFLAQSGSYGRELWLSDGTPGGTQFLADLNPGTNSSGPAYYTGFDGEVYFVNSNTVTGLWKTDQTPGGTVLINGGPRNYLASAGNSLFATYGSQFWQSDGTSNGTSLLTNFTANVAQPVPDGTNVYFGVGDDVWMANSAAGSLALAAEFSNLNPPMTSPQMLTAFQGALVFTEDGQPFGREFWSVAPGQAATLVEDLDPGDADPNIQLVVPASDKIYYVARPSGQTTWELRALRLQSINPPAKMPWGGVPWPVPGQIEAENFDLGGEGQSYHDTTIVNEGGQYRKSEAVDIINSTDTNGGYMVFDTAPGEWLDYTVNAAVSGVYELDIRMTTAAVDTGYFHFEVDGTLVDSEVAQNNGTPGGWYTLVTSVPFNSGTHVLRIVFDQTDSAGDVGVYNWFNLSLQQTNLPPTVSVTFPPSGGILSTDTPVTLQAKVVDLTTWSAPTIEYFIDGQSVGITNSPYGVSWLPTPGLHTVSAAATDSFGATGTSSNVVFYVTEPYLANGSFWRVDASGTNLPTTWRQLSYDDSHWPRARAPLGFGYRDIQTLIPSNYLSAPIPTFYFRQTFSNNLSSFNSASITLTRDDAAVVWINGQLLARVNLPQLPANVVFTNLALTNVINSALKTNAAQDVLVVPMSMLVNGTNLIAVEIHQGRPSGLDNFDLKFDLSFSTFTYALLTITDATNGVTLQWPDSFTGWNLEHSTNLTTWNTVVGSFVDTNGFFNLLLSPPLSKNDFFRLHQVSGP